MLTIEDAESAYMLGKADFEAFKKEFLLEWYRPVRENTALMFWGSLSPQMKQMFAQTNPESFAQVEQWVQSITRGNPGGSSGSLLKGG